jgi:hypothetical protein
MEGDRRAVKENLCYRCANQTGFFSTFNREVIMSLSKQGLILTALFSMLGGSTQGRNVFVLPTGSLPGGTGNANVYSPDPFTQIASFLTPQFSSNVLALPGGSPRYYVTAKAGSDTLWVLDGNNFGGPALKKYNLGTQAEASVLSGDGKRLAIAAGALHVFDTSTDLEIASFSNLDVGNTPIDVATSLDSQYVYVLSSNSSKLTAINLISGQVTATFTVLGQSTGVSVGPNGYIYVSAVNRIYELDGRNGGLTQLNAIQLNGRPGKVVFTNDCRFALAINQTSITGSIFIMVDLSNKTTSVITNLANLTLDKLVVASNNRVFALSSANRQVYDITLNPLNVNASSFNNIGSIPNVSALAVSNELPSARYLFLLTPGSVYRIDLSVSPGALSGQSVNASSGSGLVYAGPTSTATPAQALYYNTIQSSTPGGNYAPLVVRVLDSFGRPVSGAPVTFTPTSSQILVQGANQVTDGQGYAAVYVTAPATAGTYTVTANAGATGSGITAAFTLTVGSAGIGNGAIQIVSGNGQVMPEFSWSADNFVVKATDSNGQPAANTIVTFAIPAGFATLIPPINYTGGSTAYCQSNTCTAVTDATGLAAIALASSAVTTGGSFMQTTMTVSTSVATTNFIFTTVIRTDRGNQAAPPLVTVLAPTGPITASAGQTVTGAVKIRVIIQAGPQIGLPLSNVGLRVAALNTDPTLGPTASCAGGTVLTDSNGFATCDLVMGGKTGSTLIIGYVGSLQQTNLYPLTVTGPPSVIKIVQGNNQSGRTGQQLQLAFVAEVQDAAGNPLAGSPAQWEIVTQGSISLANVVNLADAQGRVSALGTPGQQPGQFIVRVRSGAAAGEFSFTANSSFDFNGDGRSDILWQQPGTGDLWVWFMNGTASVGAAPLSGGTDWRVPGAADFNADGKPDILWQQPASGDLWVWFMNGTTHVGQASLGGATDWRVVGVADINGDGKPDILWQHPVLGDLWVWYMNGTTQIGAAPLGGSTTWKVVGAADINGDGKPDILWQHPTFGDLWVWYMNGATQTGAASLGGATTWRVVGTGDFNGDGKPDILWQLPGAGDLWTWFMNGAGQTGAAPLGGTTTWKAIGAR